MDSNDQESLISSSDRSLSINRTQTYLNLSNRNQSRWPKNQLLLLLAFFIIVVFAIFIYLNLDSSQSNPDYFKPLSRRKPTLDHESIYSDSGQSMITLSDLLAHCIVAIRIAGQEVVDRSLARREKLEHVGSKGKTLEGADDIVTGVDITSHKIILNTIKDSYRRVKIVSEEDGTTEFDHSHKGDSLPVDRKEFANLLRNDLNEIERHGSQIAMHETLIWIDPLDATMEYSQNLTEYVTLMACIVHQSKPIAGVIYKPFTNKTYWSMKDFTSNKFLHSNDLRELLQSRNVKRVADKMKVIVSRSHSGNVGKLLKEGSIREADTISAGGSGYKTIELVAGQVDAYVHTTRIKKWDICASYAIINSIPSGRLTSLDGSDIGFGDPRDKLVERGLIATINHAIHDRLKEVLGHTVKI